MKICVSLCSIRSALPIELTLICSIFCVAPACAQDEKLGLFEATGTVGRVEIPGKVEFDAPKKTYRVTGSGANMWGTVDACQFVWKKVSGDVELSATIDWRGEGKNAHRKAGPMLRQDLQADSPYVDAVVHGDGLISLQFRRERGGPTSEVKTTMKPPATLKLERHGNLFTLSVAPKGESFHPAGSITLELRGEVYAGLVVCSHEADTVETAIFSDVQFKSEPAASAAQSRVRESTLETVAIETGVRSIIYRAKEHFEAPNWSRDGKMFFYNRAGKIYTLPVSGGTPALWIPAQPTAATTIMASRPTADGWRSATLIRSCGNRSSRSCRARAAHPSGSRRWDLLTGTAGRPTGRRWRYCAERNGEFDIYTIAEAGGDEKRLTDARGLDDGPDYTPDGKQIYFNSERSGKMKIWRMSSDGANQEQVTSDEEFVDWFPHPSPDGKWLVFLSYAKDVTGHPADKDVVLRIMPLSGGNPRVLATLFGGQGTINVPSWSPDSKNVAFVSYRMVPR